MLDCIIVLLSFYGLTWTIKESEIFSIPRSWLMRRSVFFFKLLSCSFCTGFHAGWIIYLIHEPIWSAGQAFLWGLASAALSYLLTVIVNKISVLDMN